MWEIHIYRKALELDLAGARRRVNTYNTSVFYGTRTSLAPNTNIKEKTQCLKKNTVVQDLCTTATKRRRRTWNEETPVWWGKKTGCFNVLVTPHSLAAECLPVWTQHLAACDGSEREGTCSGARTACSADQRSQGHRRPCCLPHVRSVASRAVRGLRTWLVRPFGAVGEAGRGQGLLSCWSLLLCGLCVRHVVCDNSSAFGGRMVHCI